MNRIRVLMVAPVAVAGGAGEILKGLALAAEAGGYEPIIVVLRPGPLVDALGRVDVHCVVIDGGRLRSPAAIARTQLDLDRLIRRSRPDVVFANEAKAHVYTSLPAARHRLPALWAHPGRPSRRSPVDVLASALPGRAVITLSNWAATHQAALPFSPPIRVIYPGIEVERFAARPVSDMRTAYGIPPEAPLVSIVGRLQPWKGQREFLEAAALILRRHPDAWFAVVGGAEMGWEEGDFPGELRAAAEALGVADRVVFTGQVDDTVPWYHASDILVLASHGEPFGLAVIEAMAAGTPVVATGLGGPAEVIRSGENGTLIQRSDPHEIAAAVMELLGDPSRARAMAGRAAAEVAEHYSIDRMARDFGAILRASAGPAT